MISFSRRLSGRSLTEIFKLVATVVLLSSRGLEGGLLFSPMNHNATEHIWKPVQSILCHTSGLVGAVTSLAAVWATGYHGKGG